jgi:hypothetical protein
MVWNCAWERCLRPVVAGVVFVLLIYGLSTPALTSESAPTPDQAELNCMLSDACGGCHNKLKKVLLETGEWKLKDRTQAFDNMAKTRT